MNATGVIRRAMVALAVLGSATAQAAAFEIDARTEAQAYQLRSYRGTDASNPGLIERRRLVQYLGLNIYELVTGQDLGFESSLRVFADLGLPRGEAEKIDGQRAEDADLLYAFVRYRGDHGLDAQLGRQVFIDVTDIMAFDGLRLRYGLVSGISAEVYGGLWVKGSGLLSSSVYQPDGTRETDARRLALADPGADPALDGLEPVIGARLLAENFAGFSATLGYRKAWLAGKTDEERASAELRYGSRHGLNGFAGVDFDLFLRQLANARAEVRYDGALVAVSAQAMRLSPVLSAESIWAYFAWAPRDEARLRVDVTPGGPVRFYLAGVGSRVNTNLNSNLSVAAYALEADTPSPYGYGGSGGVALHLDAVNVALDVTYRDGWGGQQIWGDLHGGWAGEDRKLRIDGRLSVAKIADDQNPLLRGTFYGAQLWGSYALTPIMRLSLILEGNVSPLTTLDTKAFLLYELRALL